MNATLWLHVLTSRGRTIAHVSLDILATEKLALMWMNVLVELTIAMTTRDVRTHRDLFLVRAILGGLETEQLAMI
jgi:hypothetical protein